METSLEKIIKKQHAIGYPIFESLFNLPKQELIAVLEQLFIDDRTILHFLKDTPTVLKEIRDDKPFKIELCFYHQIDIDWTGIKYKPEHGSYKQLLNFDKFFNVDILLGLIEVIKQK
jgi:hypothetical protein